MSELTVQNQTRGFKAGWWILFLFSVVSIGGHAALLFFVPGEEILFLGWAVFPLYSALILFTPYRRGEKWAWYAIWAMVISYALVPLFDSANGPYYLFVAILMALGQMLTYGTFFSKGPGR